MKTSSPSPVQPGPVSGSRYGLYTGDRRCTEAAYSIHTTLSQVSRTCLTGSKWLFFATLALFLLPQFGQLWIELSTPAPAAAGQPAHLIEE